MVTFQGNGDNGVTQRLLGAVGEIAKMLNLRSIPRSGGAKFQLSSVTGSKCLERVALLYVLLASFVSILARRLVFVASVDQFVQPLS